MEIIVLFPNLVVASSSSAFRLTKVLGGVLGNPSGFRFGALSTDIVASNGECFVMFHNVLTVFHDVLSVS